MQYFVTGATGFIGKRLVKTLLARARRRRALPAAPGERGQGRRRCSSTGAPSAARARPGATATSPARSSASRPTTSRSSRARSTTSTTWPRSTTCRPTSRVADRRQHRRHAQRGRVRQGDRRRAPAPRQLDRRGRPVRRRVPRRHVRRGRGPRPPVLHDQAREREDRAQGMQGAVDGVPPGDGRRRLARPARWTRSTARTTSSS